MFTITFIININIGPTPYRSLTAWSPKLLVDGFVYNTGYNTCRADTHPTPLNCVRPLNSMSAQFDPAKFDVAQLSSPHFDLVQFDSGHFDPAQFDPCEFLRGARLCVCMLFFVNVRLPIAGAHAPRLFSERKCMSRRAILRSCVCNIAISFVNGK